ncbi:MAG: hypothetical protein IPN01_11385 [Deltaproteobacteria bacterium]|nr:hypothetical protein [Deltaproteobacteria bacterium]
MDVLDFLKVVVPKCRLVTDSDDALSVAPDLGFDLPPMTLLPLRDGPALGLPVAFSNVLRTPLAERLVALLEPLARGQGGEGAEELSGAAMSRDPLAQTLAGLLIEASQTSPQACSLVLLELARQSSAIVDGDVEELRAVSPALAARLAPPLTRLLDFEIPARAAALQSVSRSLSARLSAAWSIASQFDEGLAPSRLHQALVRSRLPFVIPREGLDLPGDLPLAAAALGSPAEPAALTGAFLAVRAALAALEIKGAAPNVAVAGLRDLCRDRRDPLALAFDPQVAAWALHGLASLTDNKALAQSGVPKELVSALLKGQGAAALATSYVEVCRGLRAWDLLTTLAEHVVPLTAQGSGWTSTRGPLLGTGPWAWLSPRGDGGARNAFVVALRAERALHDAAMIGRESGSVAPVAALHTRWTGLSASVMRRGGVMSSGPGSIGRWVAAFLREDDATSFAEELQKVFQSPIRLSVHGLGPELTLPKEAAVQVRIAEGLVIAGWDGQASALSGPAVLDALGGGVIVSSPRSNPVEERLATLFGDDAAPISGDLGAPDLPPARDPFLGFDEPRGAPPKPAAPPPKPAAATPKPAAAPPKPAAPSKPPPPPPPPAAPKVATVAPAPLDAQDWLLGDDPAPALGAGSAPSFDLEDPFADVSPAPAAPEDPFAADSNADPLLGEGAGPAMSFLDGLADFDPGALLLPDQDPPRPAADEPQAILSFEIEDEDSEPPSELDVAANTADLFYLPPPMDAAEDPPSVAPAGLEDADLGFPLEDSVEPEGHSTPDVGGLFDGDFADLGDDEGNTFAFLEEGLSDLPSARVSPAAPPAAPQQAAPSAAEAAKVAKAPGGGADLGYLFAGYITYRSGEGRVVFARPYGDRLVDVHEYTVSRDLDEAYQSFLKDKISEGFMLRTDLVRARPAQGELAELELDRVSRAMGKLGGG